MPAPLDLPGLDFAWHGVIPYDAIKKHFGFVVRYLSHDASKDISRAEYREYEKRHIPVVLVWETTSGRADEGFNAGKADAAEAAGRAKKITGRSDCPIYFAVDSDQVTSGQFSAVVGYFKGVEHVIGHDRAGAYAEYDVIERLSKLGICKWYWQPAAWSRGLCHPAAHIYQRHNGLSLGRLSYDLDVAFKGGFGAIGQAHTSIPHRNPHKLKIWRAHLKLAMKMLKLAGPIPELQRYAAKLRSLIRQELKRPK